MFVYYAGKIFGTRANYIVAECEYQEGEGEEEEEEPEEQVGLLCWPVSG